MSSLSKKYLLAYNLAQAIGWTVALVQLVQGTIKRNSFRDAYNVGGALISFSLIVFEYLQIATAVLQGAAVMETIHAILGIVPGPAMPNFLQWAGRTNMILSVIRNVPPLQTSIPVAILLFAWTLSEVIRYPWYISHVLKFSPYWLTWLRYTAFIPLYPIGITCEVMTMYCALPVFQKLYLKYMEMFGSPLNKVLNPFNIELTDDITYNTIMKALLGIYLLFWWQLYSRLLKQRKKKLGTVGKRD